MSDDSLGEDLGESRSGEQRDCIGYLVRTIVDLDEIRY